MTIRPLGLLLLALASAPAGAVEPPAGGVADLTGARALGLAATVGAVSGNDGIFSNPASVAARRRYSVESLFLLDRRGAANVGRFYGGSVVDALSSPVAASLAYVRSDDPASPGNLFVGGLAGAIADRLYLGAQARYLSLGGLEKVSAVTADAGLFWEVVEGLSIGAAGYNLVPSGHPTLVPRGLGVGLAVGSDQGIKATGDWRADFDRLGKTSNRFAAGLEILLGGLLPLRAGYLKDEVLGTSWWTCGAGLVAPNGVALDVGYRQSLQSPDARVIGVAVKYFALEMP